MTTATARNLGASAYHSNVERIIPRNILIDHGVDVAKAWYAGYDTALVSELQQRNRRLDAIQAKFDAEDRPVTHTTVPEVLGNVVCKTRMIELAHEAITTGELPREIA